MNNPIQSNRPIPDSPSFTYTASMDGLPQELQDKFIQLGEAINAKSVILSNYKKLFSELNLIKDKLNTLLTTNQLINKSLQEDLDKKIELETEQNNLIKQLEKAKLDSTKNADIIIDLNYQIGEVKKKISEKDVEIATLRSKLGDNDALIAKIEPLLDNIQEYISKNMPITEEDVTKGQEILREINNLIKKYNTPSDQSGGYRYSSSQMRRKSKVRSSRSSRSSSSQRRRNKNKEKQTKKMMLGGRRMKKKRMTKRKNHKKL